MLSCLSQQVLWWISAGRMSKIYLVSGGQSEGSIPTSLPHEWRGCAGHEKRAKRLRVNMRGKAVELVGQLLVLHRLLTLEAKYGVGGYHVANENKHTPELPPTCPLSILRKLKLS